MAGRAPRGTASKATLDAVALQDHIARSLKLDLALPGREKPRKQAAQALTANGSTAVASRAPAGGTSDAKQTGSGNPPTAPLSTAAPAVAASGASTKTGRKPPAGGTSKPLAPQPDTPAAAPLPLNHYTSAASLTEAVASRWTCDRCAALNRLEAAKCSGCGVSRPAGGRLADGGSGAAGGTAPMDGSATQSSSNGPLLSLAQARGLVPLPPSALPAPGLSDAEWTAIETAAARHEPSCPICMDAFRLRDQVVLSCSHTFHASCLESFERYVGWAARACPMCRTPAYTKKKTKIAARAYVSECAVRIQALARGHAARTKLARLKRSLYMGSGVGGGGEGGGAVDPARKRAFLAGALASLGSALSAEDAKRKRDVDNLFKDADRNVAEARALMAAAEARAARAGRGGSGSAGSGGTCSGHCTHVHHQHHHQHISNIISETTPGSFAEHAYATALEEGIGVPHHPALPGYATPVSLAAATLMDEIATRHLAAEERMRSLAAAREALVGRPSLAPPSSSSSRPPSAPSTVDWAAVRAKALGRITNPALSVAGGSGSSSANTSGLSLRVALAEVDCPICLCPLMAAKQAGGSSATGIALLSCTHLIHEQCVAALEKFNAPRTGVGGDGSCSGPACPVCRVTYQRQPLSDGGL